MLPDLHVPVLVDETHPAHVAPAASLFAGVALAFPELVADFRQGRGVAFEEYGPELRGGLGALNRPGFTHELRGWVDALPDRAAALDAGGAVLDAGCGVGWSTIALANAFPKARIVGLDLDEASIIEARRNAIDAGVSDRVSFVHGNAGDATTVPCRGRRRRHRDRRGDGRHRRRGIRIRSRHGLRGAARHGPTGRRARRVPGAAAPRRRAARRRRACGRRLPRRSRAGRAHALRDERAALPARDDRRIGHGLQRHGAARTDPPTAGPPRPASDVSTCSTSRTRSGASTASGRAPGAREQRRMPRPKNPSPRHPPSLVGDGGSACRARPRSIRSSNP